mmetsp:Transcript_31723/g.48622  ORF Transcript_31723/g.48622 Transcript_31723/m.48622 type:complete len:115 (+) Transcript_31723:5048-5392(+)
MSVRNGSLNDYSLLQNNAPSREAVLDNATKTNSEDYTTSQLVKARQYTSRDEAVGSHEVSLPMAEEASENPTFRPGLSQVTNQQQAQDETPNSVSKTQNEIINNYFTEYSKASH